LRRLPRKRKIKCAATNTGSCAGCKRLKLNCVSQIGCYVKESNGSQIYDPEQKSLKNTENDYQPQAPMGHTKHHQMTPSIPTLVSAMYQASPYAHQQSQDSLWYQATLQAQFIQQSMGCSALEACSQPSAPTPPTMPMTLPEFEFVWRSDSASEIFDALEIDHTAIFHQEEYGVHIL
jgi:hypothetical protein